MIKHVFAILVTLSISCVSMAQGDVAVDTLRMSLFQFHGGYHSPFGDMAELYGPNASIGFSFALKSRSNFLFGAEYNFLFGNNVNDPSALFQEMQNSNGSIMGTDGDAVNYLILERGHTAGFYAGKIFPIFGPNPNSGLVIKVGAYYFEHRTWVETREDDIVPMEGEYLKMYDRKRAGLAINEFVGYQHFSNNRYANFYAGFDFYQAFTTDYRSYNADLMQRTNGDYFDGLVGIKVGWVIPVYRQTSKKFYID